jgi:hypothetical protein
MSKSTKQDRPPTDLATVPTEIIDCHLGHEWAEGHLYREVPYVKRRCKCRRCGVVRINTWGTNGRMISSTYSNYPEGYSIPDVSRDELRYTYVERHVVFNNEEDLLRHLGDW